MPESDVAARLALAVWEAYSLAIVASVALTLLATVARILRLRQRPSQRLDLLVASTWSVPIHLWAILSVFAVIEAWYWPCSWATLGWWQRQLFVSLYAVLICLACVVLSLVLSQSNERPLRLLRRMAISVGVADVLILEMLIFVLLFRLLPYVRV